MDLNSDVVTWEEFQRALDAYRDAAYWAGYRDAKSEILDLVAKGELELPKSGR